jgi:serine/threonine protein kinase/ankyrin repeat protein
MSTERIDNEGTVRLDDSGTARIDDTSTQRLDDGASTQRLDISADAAETAAIQSKQVMQDDTSAEKKTGEVFTAGQVIELNGKNYTIKEMISMSSGEAVIYKISDTDGSQLVLKYYKPGYPLPSGVLTKIKGNPRDKIIRVFDFGRHNDQDFEIMEYAEGGTLDDYLRDTGPIRDTVKLKNIVGQITEGLQQLHSELNIIYQDLKPENIYFRDREKTSIILADFGISSVMKPGENEAEVRANVTKEYAAPELARIGNQTQVIVGPPVDYFALGITMFHLWLGAKPFQDIRETARVRQIKTRDVEFPQDMPSDYKMLIQGLIDPEEKPRWGNQHIKKWLSGESLKSDYQKTSINYEQAMFNEAEGYSSPAELAALMAKYPQRGVTCLYSNIVTTWLQKSGDQLLAQEIKNIISAHTEDKEAGLYFAIYTLDPNRPFISQGGKSCSNTVEIADVLMSESIYYMEELKKKDARLYLYFEAIEGTNGREVADELRKNFEIYSPKRALTLVYLKLQDDGGKSITLGSKIYQSPEEAAAETDAGQINLIKQALQDTDSLFLVWLSEYYSGFLGSTEEFQSLPTADMFFLLSKFQFLSYKEFLANWESTAIDDLQKLIHFNPGRFDLFETYARQGLPFNGQVQNIDWHPTALNYLVTFFYDIVSDINTGLELVRFLHRQGSDLNECSGDGSLPLTTAIYKRNIPLVKLLLELGADPDKTEKYAPILWAFLRNEDGESETDRIAIVNLLLDHRANVNVLHNNISPLVWAILFDSPEKVPLVSRLISARANVNHTDDDGRSPLMDAVFKHSETNDNEGRKNALEVMELLLKNGAKIEALSSKGYWSPLMRAADSNDVDAAKLLLKYGAKKQFADADGDTAFTYAKKKKNQEAAVLLDPGWALKGKGALLSAVKIAFTVFTISWVFLTMDVLARIILSFHFIYPVQVGASILLSHLLAAYILIVIFGLRDFLAKLRGTFNFINSGLFYIVGIPIILPLAVALLQALTRLLPENITAALSFPAELLTRPSSGFAMLLLYIALLALFMGAMIIFSKITQRFNKIVRIYRQYS